MNSFRYLERGIAAELERQAAVLDGGGAVEQETFHFDPRTGSLTPLRSKEYAHDYRYLPEPDLVPLAPTDEMLREAREALPELPAERRERYLSELELPDKLATQLAFDAELAAYYERALEAGDRAGARPIANWVTGELVAALREAGEDGDPGASRVSPQALAALVRMVEAKALTTANARTVLARLVADGGDPADIVAREELGGVQDAAELEAIVERAVADNADAAERVRGGNAKAIGPIVGQVMRETRGRADGGEVTRLIHEKLGLG